MLTPLPRRKPWELAGQVATVDRLSNGRVIVSVGLGALDSGYDAFGEETDKVVRAELLDEGLDIVRGLWAGQPFSYDGKHYTISPSDFPAIGHCQAATRRADLVRRRTGLEAIDDARPVV